MYMDTRKQSVDSSRANARRQKWLCSWNALAICNDITKAK